MKLSLKQKALLQTVGVFVGSITVATAIVFILQNVSAETLSNAFAIGFVGYMGYLFYSITLSRLEYNAKLEDFNKKN